MGQEEKGIDKATGKVRVEVDPKYYRPTEVVSLLLYMIGGLRSNVYSSICMLLRNHRCIYITVKVLITALITLGAPIRMFKNYLRHQFS